MRFFLTILCLFGLVSVSDAQSCYVAPAYGYAPAYFGSGTAYTYLPTPLAYVTNNYDGGYHWFAATSYSPAGYYRWTGSRWYHSVYGYSYQTCCPAPALYVPAPQPVIVKVQVPVPVPTSSPPATPTTEVLPRPSGLSPDEQTTLNLLLKKIGQ